MSAGAALRARSSRLGMTAGWRTRQPKGPGRAASLARLRLPPAF